MKKITLTDDDFRLVLIILKNSSTINGNTVAFRLYNEINNQLGELL